LVELPQRTNVAASGVPTAFWFFTDYPTNANYFGFACADANLLFRRLIASTTSETSVTYDSTNHRWLRMRESGGTIYWDTSADGFTLTNQRNASAGALNLTSGKINLSATGSAGAATPGAAIFDNLNLSSPRAFFRFF
jgi:hypothetical protein